MIGETDTVLVFLAPLLAVFLLGGAGWYFSTMLLRPVRVIAYPERVLATGQGEVSLAPSHWAGQPGTWALRWAAGKTMVGPVRAVDRTEVRRPLLGNLAPRPGTAVAVDAGPYDHPAELGLTAEDITVATPLGNCPAWLVPAAGDTWVIAVHGRGVDRRECLRALPTLHRLGHPVLIITYRNDDGAPASPDGHYHLGDTEWEDLDAAADYALRNGATDLVLYGWSMGAAITSAFLDRAAAARADTVRAVVWDSPLLDWRATLRHQAGLRRLPRGSTELAALITRYRIGIDFDQFDLVSRPPRVRPPTLLLHGATDGTVPVAPARALSAEAPAMGWPLRYVEVPDAEHTAVWNVDPERYSALLTEFLSEPTLLTEPGRCR